MTKYDADRQFPIVDIIQAVMNRQLLLDLLQRALQILGRGLAARPPAPLSQQIARLRWQAPLLALLLVLVQQTVKRLWFSGASTVNLATEIGLYGLLGPGVVWLALGWIGRQAALKEKAEAELVRTHAELTRLNRRISFLLKVNQRLGEATDEESLSALILQLPGEILPALVGCSLTRFDEQRQPMPVIYRGVIDEASLAAWHQYLSSPSARQHCAACQSRSAWAGHDRECPLFQRSPLPEVSRVICLPLERNGREFGTLSLFLAGGQTLTDEDRRLMEALLSETTVAFENARLRSRELATLYEVNETLQLRLDFDGLMSRILNRTMEASHAEAGLMLLRDADGALSPCATAGDWKGLGRLPVVESLAEGVLLGVRNAMDSMFFQTQALVDMIDGHAADGVVFHPIKSCRTVSTGLADTRRALMAVRDVPSLFIESDLMDRRVVSEAQMKNRIDAFFEGLATRKLRGTSATV